MRHDIVNKKGEVVSEVFSHPPEAPNAVISFKLLEEVHGATAKIHVAMWSNANQNYKVVDVVNVGYLHKTSAVPV